MRRYFDNLLSSEIGVIGIVLISFTNYSLGQVVDISSTTDGIIIPRVTEEQRRSMDKLVEGLLLYQTDLDQGFYYYNGKDWLQLNNSVEGKSNITINGKEPSKYGLTYVGPTGGPGASSASNQFVNDYGYYVTIMNYDSLSNISIFYTNENCTGNMYVSSVFAGRGYVGKGKNTLYFVDKEAAVIREVIVKSNQIFNLDGAVCFNQTVSLNFLYPLKLNDPEITGINLDPNVGYKVYFGH